MLDKEEIIKRMTFIDVRSDAIDYEVGILSREKADNEYEYLELEGQLSKIEEALCGIK